MPRRCSGSAGWLLASPWIPPTLPVGRPRVAPPSSLDTPVAGSKCRHGTGEEVTPDMVIIRAETGYTQQKIQHWRSPRRQAVKGQGPGQRVRLRVCSVHLRSGLMATPGAATAPTPTLARARLGLGHWTDVHRSNGSGSPSARLSRLRRLEGGSRYGHTPSREALAHTPRRRANQGRGCQPSWAGFLHTPHGTGRAMMQAGEAMQTRGRVT